MSAAKSPTATPVHPPAEVPQSKLEQFLEANFKKIALGLGLFLVVLIAIAVARHFSHETELRAAEAFTSAKNATDCDVIIQKYAGTEAAGNAMLLKASLLWDEGKKESSVTALQEFVKDQPDHPLLPHALLGLGSKQAALGNNDDARKTLEAVSRDYAKSEVAAAAQAQLGDILWAEGKIDEAKKIFTELPRNNPGSPFIGQAEQRLKVMDAGLPTKEVDPPPAPKPVEAPKPPVPGLGVLPQLTPTPAAGGAPTINVPSLTTPPGPQMPAPASTPNAAAPSAPAPAPAAPAAPAAPKAEDKPATPAPAPAAPEAPKP